MVDVFFEEFAYLKVDPVFANKCFLVEDYVKCEIDGKKLRNIFNNVSYDNEEREKIRQIESLAQESNNHHPLFCYTGQILKFLYGNEMNPLKAFANMIDHLKWIEDPGTFSLSSLTLSHLKEGYIYLAGTDKQMRPTIVFDVGKIDLKTATEESILPAYSRIFKIAEEYYFFKQRVESWNVVIETADVSAFSLPVKILGKIITTMQNNFPSNLNRIYILNPSTSLNMTWSVIAGKSKKIAIQQQTKIKFHGIW